MPNSLEKIILFTDLSNYTLKTSLLTAKQLKELIIDKQDEIFLPLIKEFDWELVKYIGDSYMILFDNSDKVLSFSIELQKKLGNYNKNCNFNLKKIELRIVISYWKILKKETSIWVEYFWNTINIASRILEKTLKNRIFITKDFLEKIEKDKYIINYLWNYSFKWLVYKVWIYEVIYNENFVENKKIFLDDRDLLLQSRIWNIDKIIFNFSSVIFILSFQPIPLLDNYIFVMLHLYMLKEIAWEYGIKLSNKNIKEIIATISLSIWWLYSTNQLINSISKIWLPIIWWYLIAPTNFAFTYWLWKVFSAYFYYETENTKLTNKDIRDIFLWSKDKWLTIAKEQKTKIIEIWKKYKNIFLNNLNDFKDIYKSIKNIIKKKK